MELTLIKIAWSIWLFFVIFTDNKSIQHNILIAICSLYLWDSWTEDGFDSVASVYYAILLFVPIYLRVRITKEIRKT